MGDGEASFIDRARTAIHRAELSRPLQVAIADGLIDAESTVLDYGCGHGDDVDHLIARGVRATGWDPVHRPAGLLNECDVVNLGYVANVIEDAAERQHAVRDAWRFAQRTLIVSARLELERAGTETQLYDGCLTRRGTFQKFFTQLELRDWLRSTLGVEPAAAAPGIFYVFRDTSAREAFIASRFRRKVAIPRACARNVHYENHKLAFEELVEFVTSHGRLPAGPELSLFSQLLEYAGTLRRAFSVLRHIYGAEYWNNVTAARKQDLSVYMALAEFGPKLKFSQLPSELQLDIRALYGTYRKGRLEARALLYASGTEQLSVELGNSTVGKLTPSALYIHRSALERLQPVLRVYEGCARVLVGSVENANIIKLHRNRPKVSYLSYPDFDSAAHPSLESSHFVDLKALTVDFQDYSNMENRPVIHRKEAFVSEDYPARQQFKDLTNAEEQLGLLNDTSDIGFEKGWNAVLQRYNVEIVDHAVRLLK